MAAFGNAVELVHSAKTGQSRQNPQRQLIIQKQPFKFYLYRSFLVGLVLVLALAVQRGNAKQPHCSKPIWNSDARRVFRKILSVPSYQCESVGFRAGPDDRVGQFYPMDATQLDCLLSNRCTYLNQPKPVQKIPCTYFGVGRGTDQNFHPSNDADVFFPVERQLVAGCRDGVEIIDQDASIEQHTHTGHSVRKRS